ncbi:hypothetical protein FHS31_003123 [Sphingomonas vulcanisoli]|uniref:HTH cro/C1-type domain-containing protein n=1 Tax=Sphingomonas vulcanisoli TaxID=1658060 RepID=A0ABX0U0G1_9SPHN|nr:helix-turn-helix transcriptional regulator [Sphingomonas vulcanisoli]NIJ09490.1 hypothetical protein [Sphingomonas vulcanisoli]
MPSPDRKLYLGPRLRILRRELGINQTQMASELGISPSYLNHLERNQRPLTAQMLLRLADTYDVDLRDFVSGVTGADGNAALQEALSDPLVHDLQISRTEILELGENYPGVVEALVRLHGALGDLRRGPELLDQLAGMRVSAAPIDWLGTHLAARRNHFAGIESAAEALGADLPDDPTMRAEGLRALLHARFGITVLIVPADVLGDGLRHYDFHRRRLMISERLPAASRAFAVAYQVATTGLREPIEEAIERSEAPDDESRGLLKIALGNYAAAALLMPYARFQSGAEASGYDFDLLAARFGVSYEQAAQRLTTLDRSGARGIPFFLLRVDRAGNVSKRLAGAEGGAIARAGQDCPRWRLAEARHDRTIAQWVEMPDGARSFTLLRAVTSPGVPREGGPLVIALGCDARHAARIAVSKGIDQTGVTTIGPGCRLCERVACPDRAAPPVTRAVEPSSLRRNASAYPFRIV